MPESETAAVSGRACSKCCWTGGVAMVAVGLCMTVSSSRVIAGDVDLHDGGVMSVTHSDIPAHPGDNDDDGFEENDSCPAARMVPPGFAGNLVVKLLDDDWYRISVPAYARLTVTLNFVHANGDIDLMGYAYCGGPIIAASVSSADSETILINNTSSTAATYYWWVFLSGGSRNDYNMTVTVGPCQADDILENNDTCATARAMNPSGANDLIVKKSDEDWYTVTLPPFTELNATIGFSHAAGDLNMSLLAADCSNVIDTSTSTNDLETVEVANAATVAVDYRIRVYMDAGSASDCNGYFMTLEFYPLLGITSAVSRRTHDLTGDFDLDLPLSATSASAAVECRTGGPIAVIFTFSTLVHATNGASSIGLLSHGPADNQKTVTLVAIPNQTCPLIVLSGITDPAGNAMVGDNDVAIRVLAGDATGDAAVNIFDLIAIRNQLNQPVTVGNFRNDVTADGSINIFDLIATRNNLNTTVACP